MDKLRGLEPRKATASFKQLLVHGQILLRQGSNSAAGGLPSVVEDSAPQPRWLSKDTEMSFVCSATDQLLPVTAGVPRIAYYITPNVVMVNLARYTAMLFRLVPKVSPQNNNLLLLLGFRSVQKTHKFFASRFTKRASYDFDLDRSAESQHSVPQKSVCARIFGSKEELLDSQLRNRFLHCSLVISAGFIHTRSPRTVLPPDKFYLGDNVRHWVTDTSEYIQLFAVSERKRALLSLLDGKAQDIVRDEQILKDGVTDVVERPRAFLTEPIHQVEHQSRFQSRILLPGERLSIFVRELRRMSEDTFPDLHDGQREENVPGQTVIGIRVPKLRERFFGSPPHSVAAALQYPPRWKTSWAFWKEIGTQTRRTSPPSVPNNNNKADNGHQIVNNHTTPWHCVPTHRIFALRCSAQPQPTFPNTPPPSRDRPYCQCFGAHARTCGHNGTRELSQFRCVLVCTFDFRAHTRHLLQ
ncbi:hypothetical protein CLF_111682 [Clonorchis sinensis]|uniref:Uncharacterized protein n=1 Tax=Clonorchis sinensis TaxID=79923 RepID=G7YLW3_CLOSI|nr:hypothetical protein CLF_111682 [Clonorchis sinensis]